jgi:uroporphyrin-III C-methyltransferase
VVPGISSALAVPASQNIPLTCRGINESFWVVTGTNRHGELSNDIRLAARSSATVVILMAMSKLASVCDIFIEQGKRDMPAAIIQNGTRPDAKMVRGTIADISFRAAAAGLENPAIIIFGEVVNLNQEILKNKIRNNPLCTKLSDEEGKRSRQSSADNR